MQVYIYFSSGFLINSLPSGSSAPEPPINPYFLIINFVTTVLKLFMENKRIFLKFCQNLLFFTILVKFLKLSPVPGLQPLDPCKASWKPFAFEMSPRAKSWLRLRHCHWWLLFNTLIWWIHHTIHILRIILLAVVYTGFCVWGGGVPGAWGGVLFFIGEIKNFAFFQTRKFSKNAKKSMKIL